MAIPKVQLAASLFASLCFHLVALFFLQHHPLGFSQPPLLIESSNGLWISSMEKREKDQILKEVFAKADSSSLIAPKAPQEARFQKVAPISCPLTPPPHLIDLGIHLAQDHFPSPQLLPEPHFPSLSPPAEKRFDLLGHLPKDLILPLAPSSPPPPSFPRPSTAVKKELKTPSSPAEPPIVSPTYATPSFSSSLTERPFLAPLPSLSPSPDLPRFPTLAELETISHSDAFDAELIYLPREEGEGFFFALTLIPRSDLQLPKLRQHYTFLIDRSNSIQRERLVAIKQAVHRALLELASDDTFNIIVFDSKVEKFSPIPLSPTRESLAKAEAFLSQIQLGSFFSSTDLYKPLFLTLPGKAEEELHTAILFTDGESLSKRGGEEALLRNWTLQNGGRIALHVVGVGNEANLSTLEMVTAFNKGKLLHSSTKRGIKRKLLKLMKGIHAPIAQKLSCRAISPSSQFQIEFLPPSSHMPPLYLNEPCVILGTVNQLDDFILFIQGRLKDKWVHIKKPISFYDAKQGGLSLKEEWALQQARQFYEKYLLEGEVSLLAKAQHLLGAYGAQLQ